MSVSRFASIALVLAALAALGCGDDPAQDADPASQRTLAQGDVVGFAHPDHEAHAWKGIPFAQPPVGALRWRAPRPPEAWQGKRQALVSGSECPQYDPTDPSDQIGDEDCLALDVYAPRFAADAVPSGSARLPVMVWIHGGGNAVGSGGVYDAARLAAEGEVIVVTIQYRLGVLGWLSHPALRASAETADDASGNFGTLDTIRALEWVRENAAAFGGDPVNVTVFGESAGGVNVYALLLSPRAKGLFQRAIAQSGVLYSVSREEAERYADADPRQTGSNEFLLRHLLADGLASDRPGAKSALDAMAPAAIEAYLREKSAEELLAVFADDVQGGMYFVPNVIRDGHVIVDLDPLEALATPGAHNAVPTIAGTNRDETKLFSLMMSPNVRRLGPLPLGVRDEHAFALEGEYGGLLWKAQGVDQPLAALRAGGGAGAVYGYRFDWDEQGSLLWMDLSELLGAAHAVELLFVFGFTDLGRWTDNFFADPPSAERLSQQMRAYWTHFARTGEPGKGARGDLPPWRAWGSGERHFLVFDTPADGGLRMEDEVVTVDGVVDRLAKDPRVNSAEERCALYRGLVQWSGALGVATYEAFADGGCREWPLELPALAGG